MRRICATFTIYKFIAVLLLGLFQSQLTNAAQPSLAEGKLANGLRVVVSNDAAHSSTTIALTLPMRLVYGYEHSWQSVAELWRDTSPTRFAYSLPGLESPVLILRASLDDDPMALPELISAIRGASWKRAVPGADEGHWPSSRWFNGSQVQSDYPPQPNDFFLVVNGTQPVDALWELVKSAGNDWNGKAQFYRTPQADTVPHLWFRHRAGESSEIVMYQQAPPALSAGDGALRAFVADERLERSLSRVLIRGDNGACDCEVGLYPPLAPQWLWCAISGPAEETSAMMRDINIAWSTLLSSPFIPVRTNIEDAPRSHDRRLIDYTLSRLYQSPAAPADSEAFRVALQTSILQERWTYLVTTDTSRCTLPENFLYHNW